MIDVELQLLPSGQTLCKREDESNNNELIELLKELGIDNFDELKEFLQEGNMIDQVFGDEKLCG